MNIKSVKTILALSVVMALQITSFVIILPLFARRFSDLGAGVEALGISAMAYAITSTVAAPLMGALADRFGRRPLILVSLAAYVAAFSGYLLAQSATAIIVTRGLAGAFTAGLTPAVTGLAADIAPRGRQAQWIGFMNAGAAFGWIAGPIAGGMLYDRWGYSTALIVSIAIAALTLWVAFLGVPESPLASRRPVPSAGAQPDKPAGLSSHTGHDVLRDFRSTLPRSLAPFITLLVIFFAVVFAWAFIEPRFMFYAYNDLGWSSSMLGLVMSTYGVAMVVGELALSRLSDWVGRKPIIILGLALFSAQFIGLAFFKNYMLVAVSFVIAGLGNALYDPAISASILDISPEEHRARILGIKSMVGSTGSILGPALIALMNASMGARSVFLVSVGAVLLTTLIGLALPGKDQSKPEPGMDSGAENEPLGMLGE